MVWLTVGAPAQAQEAISNAMHVRQPYNIETFGAFRMLNGDGAQRAPSRVLEVSLFFTLPCGGDGLRRTQEGRSRAARAWPVRVADRNGR